MWLNYFISDYNNNYILLIDDFFCYAKNEKIHKFGVLGFWG